MIFFGDESTNSTCFIKPAKCITYDEKANKLNIKSSTYRNIRISHLTSRVRFDYLKIKERVLA